MEAVETVKGTVLISIDYEKAVTKVRSRQAMQRSLNDGHY